jgi:hypothetical protein
MRISLLVIVGAAFVTVGALAAASGQAGQKAAAASMVVYKSAT